MFKKRWSWLSDIDLKVPKPLHSSDSPYDILKVDDGPCDLEYNDLLWVEAGGVSANNSKALRECLKPSSQTSPLLCLRRSSGRR